MNKHNWHFTPSQTTEEAFEAAYAAFPELHDKTIELRLQTMRTTMQARPTTDKNRFVLLFGTGRCEYPLFTLPFEDQVAWIAHELTHCVEYTEMSRRNLIVFGIKYFCIPRYRRMVEHRVELKTMARGFSQEVIRGVERYFSALPAKTRMLRKLIYPGPGTLRRMHRLLGKHSIPQIIQLVL